MLKLNASFSKKVPVPGEDYSSQSFHASVEVELPDGLSSQDLQGRIHQTFALVRDSVEAELAARCAAPADPPPAVAEPPSRALPARTAPESPRRDARREGTARASLKQVSFLSDLAARQGMDAAALAAAVTQRFGAARPADLTRGQASQFIEELQNRRAA